MMVSDIVIDVLVVIGAFSVFYAILKVYLWIRWQWEDSKALKEMIEDRERSADLKEKTK